MSLETVGAILLALLAAVGFGAVQRRRTRSAPSAPPASPEDEAERLRIATALDAKLDDVNDAANSDTPEQDAADLLNQR